MSFFRSTVWFLKGMREYTKSGYETASKKFNANDLSVDVKGNSFVITGANSGIGKIVALEIAKRGGTVHLVCRNEQRGAAAVQEIQESTDNQSVFLHVVDLSKPVDVYKFAEKFKGSQEKLDVLVNNAGCMVSGKNIDSMGFETNFATNTLAVHILTESLVPLLKKSSDPRVVNVSSGGMLTEKLNLSDLQSTEVRKFDATAAYAQQKRQQVIMTEIYADRYPEIKFSSMHPGWADTPAVAESLPSFHAKMQTRLRTPEQGADTVVWLALSPSAKLIESGKFFQDRQAVPTHLPLAWSQSSAADCQSLMTTLGDMYSKVTAAASATQS